MDYSSTIIELLQYHFQHDSEDRPGHGEIKGSMHERREDDPKITLKELTALYLLIISMKIK